MAVEGGFGSNVEYRVALQTIVEHARSYANHRLGHKLVGDTQTWRVLESPGRQSGFRITAAAGKTHSVSVETVHKALAIVDEGTDQGRRSLRARQGIDGDAGSVD